MVPIDELDVTPDGQILMAGGSEDQLREMPEYQEAEFETTQVQQ